MDGLHTFHTRIQNLNESIMNAHFSEDEDGESSSASNTPTRRTGSLGRYELEASVTLDGVVHAESLGWDHSTRTNDDATPGGHRQLNEEPKEDVGKHPKAAVAPPTLTPKFPIEILELMLSHLSKSELLPVLRSNRAMYAVGVRLVYREVVEGGGSSSGSENGSNAEGGVKRCVKVLKGLVHRDSIRSSVSKGPVTVGGGGTWDPLTQDPCIHIRKLDLNLSSLTHPTPALYNLLHALLKRTVSLHTLLLDLPKMPHHHQYSPVWILEGEEIRFKLRVFSTSMHCTERLAKFLAGQDGIVKLTLRGLGMVQSGISSGSGYGGSGLIPYLYMDLTQSLNGAAVAEANSATSSPSSSSGAGDNEGGTNGSNPFTLPPSALPRLRVFNAIHAGPSIVKSVVQGRPVTTASIPLYSRATAMRSLDALADGSTVGVRKLSVISFDPSAPVWILEEVAKRFGEVVEALNVVVLLAEFTNDLLVAACPHLRLFKRLKYITCVATSSEDSSLAEEQDIAEKWHDRCPTLRTIILPKGRVWFQARAAAVARVEPSGGQGGDGERSWECLDDE